MKLRNIMLVLGGLITAGNAAAAPFVFNNGDVDGRIASATRPGTNGKFEIESGDDFLLTQNTRITGASFTGLLPIGADVASIGNVRVEIYRVFPKDSDRNRTSGPPTFSTPRVPTRVNSPSDVAFAERESTTGTLSFTVNTLADTFSTANSLLPGGIQPIPNQNTGGNGPVRGREVRIDVSLNTPFNLPADHYFFVPQVQLSAAGDDFLWLSSVRPIVSPGTPFTPDLQAWARDQFLAPDWLRIGTDVVGGTTFNLAFSLQGRTIPEPGSVALLGLAAIGLIAARRRA
jgi:hypothetical protein